MERKVNACMKPELAQLCDTLRAGGCALPLYGATHAAEAVVVPVRELLEGDRLHRLIDRIADKASTKDRVAAASQFQKRYSGVLLGAVLSLMTRAGVGLRVEPEHLAVLLVDDLPAGLLVSDEVVPLVLPERLKRVDPGMDVTGWDLVKYEDSLRSAVYESLFDNHLGPLAMRIATEVGLSLRVMWGNIGNYCCYAYDAFCEDEMVKEQAVRDRDSLMTCSGIGGTPLSCSCDRVYLEELAPPMWVRVRSTCCLRYKLDADCCATCPRLSHQERLEIWSEVATK